MFDILTIAAIADEFSSELLSGRVQKTGLRDRGTLVCEIYSHHRRRYLVAAIGGNHPCCYLSDTPVGIDAELVTPLSLMLRKHLRGGTITSVWHPPQDRIIRLSIAKREYPLNGEETPGEGPDTTHADQESGQDDAPIVSTVLYLEIMGRRSNAILVNDGGLMMESLKRVTRDMSRVRPILPKRPYETPPVPDKYDSRKASASDLEAIARSSKATDRIADSLVRQIMALSPQMAREAVFRAVGDSAALWNDGATAVTAKIADEIRRLGDVPEQGLWSPSLYRDSEDVIRAYSAIPMEHLAGKYREERVDSMSAAVASFVAQSHDLSSRHEGRKQRLAAKVSSELGKATRRLRQLEEQTRQLADADRYRRWGDAIYANLWRIEAGQAHLDVDGEGVPLDPDKSANENAQHYFKRYRRSTRGSEDVASRTDDARREVSYLEEFAMMVSHATTFDEIESLRREWEGRYGADKAGQTKSAKSGRNVKSVEPIVDPYGNRIFVGRSSQQNDLVTFSIGNAQDYWFHARGVPGSHVILKIEDDSREESELALELAASLAAYFSAAREATTVEVDICLRKDVRKIKGGRPGLVTYRNERTVAVTPLPPESQMAARNASD